MSLAARAPLLVALAVVALLILLWHQRSAASRTGAGRTVTTAPPEAAARGETADAEAAGAGEEEGCGEEEQAYRLAVVSRRDGSPVPGARVLAEDGACCAATGAEGVAEFRAGRGRWWRVSAPGFFPVDVDFDAGGNGWVALAPATTVAGTVIDAATRRPIGGAEVELSAEDRDLGFATAETDASGRFEVVGALWRGFSLVARASDYCPATVGGSLTGPLSGLEVALSKGATLEGRVAGADGAPASGQRVFVKALGEKVPDLDAYTDEEGDYRLLGLPLGVEMVPWTEPRFRVATGVARGEAVVFKDPGETRRRDITLPATAALAVAVRDPRGEAVAITKATLESDAGVLHAADGNFEAPPGPYRLTVCPRGWPDQQRDVVLEAGGSRVDVVLSPGLTVEGTVVARGESGLPAWVHWSNGALSSRVLTDEEGRFRIEGLPATPGRLSVDVYRRAVAVREDVVPGGPPVVIDIQPAARITGRAAGAVQGRIWSDNCAGSWDDYWGDSADVWRFEFVVVRLGEPVTLAFLGGVAEAPVVLSLPALAAGEERDVGEIRFDAGRDVRGRVRGHDGNPATGALVDVAEAWAVEHRPRVTRTDETGRFCLLRVPKAPFWVRVDMEGYPPHFLRVEEDALDLRLTTGGVAEGRGRASLLLSGLSDWADNATVDVVPDADGSYSVRLQPGKYRGWTEGEGGRTIELSPFVIREGEATRVDVKPR